jgi:hypothetical protein
MRGSTRKVMVITRIPGTARHGGAECTPSHHPKKPYE